jgi:low affinity Fe/Cu permease
MGYVMRVKKPSGQYHHYLPHGGSFAKLARAVAFGAGQPASFLIASLVILIWGITGPIFHFSDTWQLVINTGTTIITFLMVFLIQNTQNRDSQAAQLKLDEIIRALEGAHTAILDLEELSDKEILEVRQRYLQIAVKGRDALRKGLTDTGTPEISMNRDLKPSKK